MDKQISHNIVETCKKLGINYKSCNANYVEYYTDAQELAQIYRDLKESAAKLKEIAEKHNIDNIGKFLDDEVNYLEQIDHDIIKLAHQINKEIKNG